MADKVKRRREMVKNDGHPYNPRGSADEKDITNIGTHYYILQYARI